MSCDRVWIDQWLAAIHANPACAHPKTLRNDLYLWGVENTDPTRADRTDASKVPLYLCAGEHDFICPPELVEATARRIGSAVPYETLSGLGHFPTSGDYTKFRPVLLETLDAIEQKNNGIRHR